jgi:hypothetical protein
VYAHARYADKRPTHASILSRSLAHPPRVPWRRGWGKSASLAWPGLTRYSSIFGRRDVYRAMLSQSFGCFRYDTTRHDTRGEARRARCSPSFPVSFSEAWGFLLRKEENVQRGLIDFQVYQLDPERSGDGSSLPACHLSCRRREFSGASSPSWLLPARTTGKQKGI